MLVMAERTWGHLATVWCVAGRSTTVVSTPAAPPVTGSIPSSGTTSSVFGWLVLISELLAADFWESDRGTLQEPLTGLQAVCGT